MSRPYRGREGGYFEVHSAASTAEVHRERAELFSTLRHSLSLVVVSRFPTDRAAKTANLYSLRVLTR